MAEPIINPWFIYLADISRSIEAMCAIFLLVEYSGALCIFRKRAVPFFSEDVTYYNSCFNYGSYST